MTGNPPRHPTSQPPPPNPQPQKVVTPNVFNFDLWKTSGHADHYRENMFAFDVEKQEFGLKPMNCPGHCVMFANRARSYRCGGARRGAACGLGPWTGVVSGFESDTKPTPNRY
jgi:hypothetical protein